MNGEINEILEEMKSIIDTGKDRNGIKVDGYGFHGRDLKMLYDCITNLQQENEEWGMIFDTFSSRPYAHRYLEEKRKELGNKRIIGLDSEMIYKDYYDYKSRCEKALDKIQYIIDYGFDYDGFNTVETLKGLIDMLVDYAKDARSILKNDTDLEGNSENV